ncbi:hypothetical protein QVD17_38614 [Tagetes erecta]|uniref:Uncharacterized protein n=1 Tax=Tagetes erecta TaxID=13708 RepID=A0AAD8JM70_TARER|nr:hypothetical protein QVD17_38614 [Tagetes erecta]
MSRRQFLYLLYTSSSRPPSFTPNFAAPPPSLLFCKRYCHESTGSHATDDTINHERAPSTLEEFKRLEEEKANEGVVSQISDKVTDGAMEAVTDDDSFECVKETFKNPAGTSDTRRTGEFQNTG